MPRVLSATTERHRACTSAAAAGSTVASPRGAIHENTAVLPLQLLHAAATAPPAAWNAVVPRLGSDRLLDLPRPTRVKKRAGEPCQNEMLLPYKHSDDPYKHQQHTCFYISTCTRGSDVLEPRQGVCG